MGSRGRGDRARAAALLAVLLAVAWGAASCGPASGGGTRPSPSASRPDPTFPCCTHGPTAPPGAITRDEAVSKALAAAPARSTPSVIWAEVVEYPFEPPDPARDLVWAVRLSGLTAPACPTPLPARPLPASSAPCLDGEHGANVALDVTTGGVLGWYP